MQNVTICHKIPPDATKYYLMSLLVRKLEVPVKSFNAHIDRLKNTKI